MPLDSAAFWWRPRTGVPVNTGRSIVASGTKNMMRTNPATGGPTDPLKCTISFWARQTLDGATYSIFLSADGTNIDIFSGYGDNTVYYGRGGNGVIRTYEHMLDTSEWVHHLWQLDSTQAVAGNRVRAWLNGIYLTTMTIGSSVGLNVLWPWTQNSAKIGIACYSYSPTVYRWQGYLHYPVLVDGVILNPDSFGYFDETGKWMPKQYLGSVGNRGFIVDFSDDANLGKDLAGNGDFTTTYTTDDIYNDKPQVTYPLYQSNSDAGGAPTFAESRLSVPAPAAATTFPCPFTHVLTSGKWYWEVQATVAQTSLIAGIGICEATVLRTKKALLISTGVYQDETGAQTAYGSAWATNEVIAIELDLDASPATIRFRVGGVWRATKNLDATVKVWEVINIYQGNAGQKFITNFGAKPFSIGASVGFNVINSVNIAAPINPEDYFGSLQWAGNGGAQGIGGLNFTPDMVWIKNRAAAESMMVQNSVRGAGKYLLTGTTAGEVTDATTVTGFVAGGISLGASVLTNKSGSNYIAYCWKKSPAAGFDIVVYNGDGTASRNISHGLGKAPKVVIIKRLDATAAAWPIFDLNMTTWAAAASYMVLNTTAARVADATVFPINPTATDVVVGNNALVNANGIPYIAFIFTDILGLSRFDLWDGAAGDLVKWPMTFRPGLTIRKGFNAADAWALWDNKRPAANGNQMFHPTTATAEASNADALSKANCFQGGSVVARSIFWSWGVRSHRNSRAVIPGYQ